MSKLSRRLFLARAAGVVGVLPLLAACQQAAQPAATATKAATTAPAATAAATAAATKAATTAPAATAAATAAATKAATAGAYVPPAAIKGTTLNILWGTFFAKAWQDSMTALVKRFGTEAGVTINIDFLGWADLQPKIGAALQAGGLDICELWPGWHHLYKASLVDVTDIAKEVETRGNGWEPYVQASGPEPDGKYFGVPHGESNGSIAYRISWFKEAITALGLSQYKPEDGTTMDMTWEDYHKIGVWLKQNKQKPFGQALGHSTGDPPGLTYPYMWSYGSQEVKEDAKTVAFNTPQFVTAMKAFITAYKQGYDDTGLSWDDSANNRAFQSQALSATYNGSSIYFSSKNDPAFKAVADDTNHMLMPKGPSGRFYRLSSRTTAILAKSRNVDAAKEYVKWFFQDNNYGEYFRVQEGYQLQNTKKWANDPMWDKDPKMKPYKDQPKYGRDQGYAGPNNEKAAEVYSKYIIVDTFNKAVASGDAEGSIKWGEDQLKRIYGG
ncbi:MAG: extracellular solute-binding protein [Chloroflexota bacterium]